MAEPIHAQLPDGTILEFPSGTPQGVIDMRVRQHLNDAKTPTKTGQGALSTVDSIAGGMEQAGKYAVTQGTKMLTGTLGLPRAIGDMYGDWRKSIGLPRDRGSIDLPSTRQMDEFAFGTLGLPEVTGEQVLPTSMRNMAPFLDAGFQGALGGGALGGAKGILPGAMGGVGAETAGNIPGVQGTALEPFARLAGGGVGAGGGAALQNASRYGNQVVRSVTDPFTTAGRDRIIGQTLNRAATGPDAAVSIMRQPRQGVPGSNPTAAQIANDPGLLSFENAFKGQVGPGGEFAMRTADNNTARMKAADAVAPVPTADQAGDTIRTAMQTRKDALTDVRSQAAGPMYEASRIMDPAINGKPILDSINKAIMTETGPIRSALQEVKKSLYLGEGKNQRMASRPGEWQAVRRAIDAQIKTVEPGSPIERQLVLVRNQVDDELKSGAMFKMADETFARLSDNLRPYDKKYGPRVAKALETGPYDGPYVQPAETIPDAFIKRGGTGMDEMLGAAGFQNQGVKQAVAGRLMDDFKASIRTTADDPLGNKVLSAAAADRWWQANKDMAAKVMTKDQVRAMEALVEDFGVGARRPTGVTNSMTAQNLASGNMLNVVMRFPILAESAVGQSLARPLQFLYKMPEDQIRTRLIEVLQDPKIASALMVKANPANARLLEPMLRQAFVGSVASTPQIPRGQ